MKNDTYIESLHIAKESVIKVRESFNLLKMTTDQVSTEAVQTAEFLKKQLSQTNYKFFHVIDSINDLVVIKDGHGRWKTLNKFTQKLYGFKSIQDFYNKTDKELSEEFPHHNDGLQHCINTDNLAWESKDHYRAIESFEIEGDIRHFDIIKTPIFEEDGSKKELIVIGRDITDLKNAEIRTKACLTALNSASDLLLIINKNGFITFANNMFLEIFDFKNSSEVEHKKLFEVLSKYSLNSFDGESILNIINIAHSWTDYILINKNSCILKYSTTIIPIMNGEPRPIYYICRMHLLNQ